MTQGLRADLVECAEDLGKIIEAHKARWVEGRGYDPAVTVWQALDTGGRPLLVDALAARAQILIALSGMDPLVMTDSDCGKRPSATPEGTTSVPPTGASQPSYPVRVEVDAAVGMIYVALAPPDHDTVARTVDYGRVRLDLGAQGRVYGIEIDGPFGEVEIVDAPAVTFQASPGNPTITADADAPSQIKPPKTSKGSS